MDYSFCVYVYGWYSQKELPCCWECKTCRNNEIIVNGTRCQQCNLTTWPDDVTATQCLPIAATYLRWTDTLSVALLVLTLIGKMEFFLNGVNFHWVQWIQRVWEITDSTWWAFQLKLICPLPRKVKYSNMNKVHFKDLPSVVASWFVTQEVAGSNTPILQNNFIFYRFCRIHLGKTRIYHFKEYTRSGRLCHSYYDHVFKEPEDFFPC